MLSAANEKSSAVDLGHTKTRMMQLIAQGERPGLDTADRCSAKKNPSFSMSDIESEFLRVRVLSDA